MTTININCRNSQNNIYLTSACMYINLNFSKKKKKKFNNEKTLLKLHCWGCVNTGFFFLYSCVIVFIVFFLSRNRQQLLLIPTLHFIFTHSHCLSLSLCVLTSAL